MTLIGFMGVVTLLNFAPAASSQEIPQDILRQIQKQQTGSPERKPSPVDVARDRQLPEDTGWIREEAPVSRLEIDFRERSDSDSLSQYGYDMFSEALLRGMAEPVGRIDDSYILGIGDEIVVTLMGGTGRNIITQVDSEGRVILPDLRPVPAAGRTFGAFRRDLAAQVSANLLGTEVFVSVGSVRQVGILVLGEVNQPGMHQMTSLSSVLDALTVAGVKKTGSLRSIRIHTADQVTELDIYELMQGNVGVDVRLREGMRIVVPIIGSTVAVTGQVLRPGIYELASGAKDLSGAALVSMGGGLMRPLGNEFTSNELAVDGSQTLRSLDIASGRISAGSILNVARKKNIINGQVSVEGHVGVAGSRSIDNAATLSELVDGADGLGRSPYLLFAILKTKDPTTQSRLLKAVDLERVLAGAEDVALRDEDVLYVLSASDVSFLSSPDIRNAILTTRARKGSCSAVSQFAGRLSETDVRRYASVVRSVFVTRENAERAQLEAQEAPTEMIGGAEVDLDDVASGELAEQQAGVVTLDGAGAGVKNNCSRLFDKNPELLPFALEHATSVTGAVRRPGVYPVAGMASISSLASVAGGFANNADLRSIELLTFTELSSEGIVGSGREYIDATVSSLSQAKVTPGSSVRFDSLQSDQEPGTILLSGEFGKPGVYSITRGETLGEIIERAGGITTQAYPYGAQLTRVSVKREQEQAFRRAARELNNALASVILRRRDVSADAIIAAQGLADSLATVEAPGRVVVEADPAVLRTRPELDVILEPGDTIHIPKRPSFVVVAGDVLNPGALQFLAGKEVGDYIEQSGGLQSSADKGRVFVVYPNGVAEPVNISRWSSSTMQIPPGSTLVVPKSTSPMILEIVRDVTGIVGQLALAAASLAVISN